MNSSALESLIGDTFVLKFGIIANANALQRALAASNELQAIRNALSQDVISEQTIRRFISRLLQSFQPTRLFPHDLALAALAVVMADRPTDFAEEFLSDLAKLNLTEMPMAIRVARQCLKTRSHLARNQSAICRFAIPGDVPKGWHEAVQTVQPMAGQKVETLRLGAA